MMLPITFRMEPLPSMVFLTAIYIGGCFGGSISAILLKIPGTPQAVATAADGYPLLIPVIVVFSVIGTYAIRNTVFDEHWPHTRDFSHELGQFFNN